MRVYHLMPKDSKLEGETALLGSVASWHSLGLATGLTPQHLAFALQFRDMMQTRIVIGDRTVYESAQALREVQTRIAAILDPLLNKMENNEVVLSYRKKSYIGDLRKCTNSARLISWDIRKYYDNVRLDHIVQALLPYGFSVDGAKLIGRYCLVDSKRGPEKIRTAFLPEESDTSTWHEYKPCYTLQQGCPASPAISNLVGYEFIDKPVLEWLKKNCRVKYRYVRYCDNVELFLFEDPPQGFYAEYKKFVEKLLKQNGFSAHDWMNVGQHNPKANMQFLGIVLNKNLRLGYKPFDNLRATLHNMATKDFEAELRRFRGIGSDEQLLDTDVKGAKATMKGHISYVRQFNTKQADKLAEYCSRVTAW